MNKSILLMHLSSLQLQIDLLKAEIIKSKEISDREEYDPSRHETFMGENNKEKQ